MVESTSVEEVNKHDDDGGDDDDDDGDGDDDGDDGQGGNSDSSDNNGGSQFIDHHQDNLEGIVKEILFFLRSRWTQYIVGKYATGCSNLKTTQN